MEVAMARTNVVSKSEPSSNASDAELVLLGAQGSDMAFEFIMRRYNRLLFRTARSIVDNDADAEEVLQKPICKPGRHWAVSVPRRNCRPGLFALLLTPRWPAGADAGPSWCL